MHEHKMEVKVVTAEMTEKAQKRTSFINSLREYATLLETHPEVPAPNYNQYFYMHDCTKEQLAAAATAGIKAEKSYTDENFSLILRLGNRDRWSSDINLYFSTKREEVCERVVVGKKLVPEKIIPEQHTPSRIEPAHEVDVVEWKCSPLLQDEEV